MENLIPCPGCMGETVTHSCGMKSPAYRTVVELLEERVKELQGLYLAECKGHRVTGERMLNAEVELHAWHTAFGTTQLTHAQAKAEVVIQENKRLKREVEALREYHHGNR